MKHKHAFERTRVQRCALHGAAQRVRYVASPYANVMRPISQAPFYRWIDVLARRVAQDRTRVPGLSANHRFRICRCSTWQTRRNSSSEATLLPRSEAAPRPTRAIRKNGPSARPHPCASTRRSNDTPLISAHTGWPVVRPRRATESRVMRARRCCAGVPGRSSSTSA